MFEVFTVNAKPNCAVEIIMPPDEKTKLIGSLNKYNNLVKLLTSSDIEAASASKEMDKVKITKLVKSSSTGVIDLNNNVAALIWNCIQKLILAAVEECEVQSKVFTIDLEYVSLCYDGGKTM